MNSQGVILGVITPGFDGGPVFPQGSQQSGGLGVVFGDATLPVNDHHATGQGIQQGGEAAEQTAALGVLFPACRLAASSSAVRRAIWPAMASWVCSRARPARSSGSTTGSAAGEIAQETVRNFNLCHALLCLCCSGRQFVAALLPLVQKSNGHAHRILMFKTMG